MHYIYLHGGSAWAGGNLEEAKLVIDTVPLVPNEATWGALLGVCRSDVNVEFGKFAASELLKLECIDSSAHMLLSNTYTMARKWQDVSRVRTLMQERGSQGSRA